MESISLEAQVRSFLAGNTCAIDFEQFGKEFASKFNQSLPNEIKNVDQLVARFPHTVKVVLWVFIYFYLFYLVKTIKSHNHQFSFSSCFYQ